MKEKNETKRLNRRYIQKQRSQQPTTNINIKKCSSFNIKICIINKASANTKYLQSIQVICSASFGRLRI